MTNDAGRGPAGAGEAGPEPPLDRDERQTAPLGTTPPPVTAPPAATAGPPPWTPPPAASSLGAFTARYGLVRPAAGRQFAGVCAAIGRATNTDPVLWRVLFAVLTLFGGVGLLAYLVCWLAIPAEGDTAAPVEALVGRGQSSTSPVTVILVGLLAVVVLAFIASDGFRIAVLAAAVLLGAALLLNRGGRAPAGRYGGGYPGAPVAPGPAPWGATARPGTGTQAPGWAAEPPPPVPPAPDPGSAAAAFPGGPEPAPAQFLAEPGRGPAPPIPPQPAGSPAVPPSPIGGYRPAFAPHGPYAAGGGYPPPGFPRPPHVVVPPVPPAPPRPPQAPGRLVRVVLSLACLALGILAAVDLASGRVRPSAYFATALAVIGLGLVAGAWVGRARWLIPIGLAVTVALGISSGVERFDHVQPSSAVEWRPRTFDELAPRYDLRAGNATLDLRALDFTGRDDDLVATVRFGSLRVLLPPEVDVDVRAEINAGEARVLGTAWGGLNQGARDLSDDGPDGPGGGQLRLIVNVNAGDLEVDR